MRISTIFLIFLVNLKTFIKKIFKLKIVPYKILINLTDLCNSRCAYCDIWKIKPQNEIDLAQAHHNTWQAIMRELHVNDADASHSQTGSFHYANQKKASIYQSIEINDINTANIFTI